MSKLNFLVLAVLLVAVTVFGWVGIASAHSFRTGTNVTLGQGQKINETIFAAGRTVDINSEVNGDIFCAGQTITISGTVHGDVICAGQTVNISGTIDGDIRLAGQTVTIGATVAGNATLAGQSINLESTGKINGDVSIGATDVVLNGVIGRDVAMGGNSLIISNTVGRNIKATIKNLQLTSSAVVNGNVNYTSSQQANIASGAKVGGKVTQTEPTKTSASKHWAIFGFGIAWFIYWILAMLFTAMALILLFPRAIHAVSQRAMPRPWKALLTGFVASVVAPFILFILAITVVGLPLAFIAGMIGFIILFLSGPLFGYYIGRLVLRESKNALLIMLVGAAILLVLYFIPIIGFFALLAATWIGSGMLLLELFNIFQKPHYQVTNTNHTPKKKS